MGEMLNNPRHVLMKVKFSRNQQKEPFDGQCRRGSTDAEFRPCGIFGRDDKIFRGRTGRWEEEVRRCIWSSRVAKPPRFRPPNFCFNICFHWGHDMNEGLRKSCEKDLVRTWPFQVEAHNIRATLNVLSTLPHARSCVCMSAEGMSGCGA